jgi:hypothetical protein
MKNLKSILTTMLFTAFICYNSMAQTNVIEKKESNFSVKYTGEDGDYLYFVVEIKDETAKNKNFKINDKAEGELYSDIWESNSNIQNFKIEKKDGQVLTFNLKAGKNVYSKTYSFTKEMIEKSIVTESNVAIL